MSSNENCFNTFLATLYPELNETKDFMIMCNESLTLNSFMKDEIKYSLMTAKIRSTSKSFNVSFFFYKIDSIGGKTSIIESKAGDPPHNLSNDHLSKIS